MTRIGLIVTDSFCEYPLHPRYLCAIN